MCWQTISPRNSFRSTFVFTLECSTLLKLKRGNVSAIFGLGFPFRSTFRIRRLANYFRLPMFRAYLGNFWRYLWPELCAPFHHVQFLHNDKKGK